MLKEYKSMTQEEMYTLVHEIYIEGCMENAREKYPDATDLTTAIQQEEDSFCLLFAGFFYFAGKYLLCSGKRQYACKCRQIK